jgi:hypothetical protein
LICQCGVVNELAEARMEIDRLKKLVIMQSLELSMLRHADVWNEFAQLDKLSDEALANFESELEDM